MSRARLVNYEPSQVSETNVCFFFLSALPADGDENEEDIRRGIIGADDAGGRQKLLRTIWPGEYECPR